MKVLSTNGSRLYEVNKVSCTCPDFTYRKAKLGKKCKHILKIYYPKEAEKEELRKIREQFKGGINVIEAFDRFGEKIPILLNNHVICESNHEGRAKFYLLE